MDVQALLREGGDVGGVYKNRKVPVLEICEKWRCFITTQAIGMETFINANLVILAATCVFYWSPGISLGH